MGAGIAWGIIDALLYLVVIVYERNRYIHVADDLQCCKDEKAALDIIQEDLEDSIVGTLDVEDQERIYKDVLGAQRRVGYADKARGISSLGREDYLGAFQVFLAMLVATLVVVVPLLRREAAPCGGHRLQPGGARQPVRGRLPLGQAHQDQQGQVRAAVGGDGGGHRGHHLLPGRMNGAASFLIRWSGKNHH